MIFHFEDFLEQTQDKDVIAPLFARFDSKCGGGVYFHEYTRKETDDQSRDIISRCNKDIEPLETGFSTEMALVITWENMYPEKCQYFSNLDLYPDFKVGKGCG